MPEISTASLTDIIFMLLFLFMVVTVMKDSTLKIDVTIPSATELEKVEPKSLVSHLYIGKPKRKYQAQYGTAPRIQLNDSFQKVNEIPIFLEKEKMKLQEEQRPFMTASLRVDEKVTMGIVTDVKTELRKAGQLKINYSSKARTKAL